MMNETSSRIQFASSSSEAAKLLAGDESLGIVAGATWIMRAPLRQEALPERFLSLSRIPELKEIRESRDGLEIGCLVTHDELAHALADDAELKGLANAAGRSANPGVRKLATIGGNLAARDFPAPDLVPALLALDAVTQVQTADGLHDLPLAEFIQSRDRALLTCVKIPRTGRRSAHARLTMKASGDYPVAIISISAVPDGEGRISDPRVAIGAVAATACRWQALEAAIAGHLPDASALEKLAEGIPPDIEARDSADVPGWYRLQVLPHLVRLAIEDLKMQFGGAQ